MRLILFFASALMAGAVGVVQGVIPLPAQMMHAVTPQGGDPAPVNPANVNPADAYKPVLPQILRGSAPADQGFHGSAVTVAPGSVRGMTAGAVNAGAIGQDGVASGIASQIQQNNIRMQDMANFARDPSAWHGAPPR